MLHIINAYLKPITSPDIPCGEMLIDGGKIVAIGETVNAPEGCEVIDAQGALVCPGFDVRAVTDGTLLLPPAAKGTVFSVFAFGGAAEGVSIRGGKYALEGVTVECTGSLGVSNEFLDGEVSVSVARGTLMVFSYGV